MEGLQCRGHLLSLDLDDLRLGRLGWFSVGAFGDVELVHGQLGVRIRVDALEKSRAEFSERFSARCLLNGRLLERVDFLIEPGES